MFVILFIPTSFDAESKLNYAMLCGIEPFKQKWCYMPLHRIILHYRVIPHLKTIRCGSCRFYQLNDSMTIFCIIKWFFINWDMPITQRKMCLMWHYKAMFLTYQQNKGLEVRAFLTTATMNALDAERNRIRRGTALWCHCHISNDPAGAWLSFRHLRSTRSFRRWNPYCGQEYQLNNSLDVTGTISTATQKSLEKDLTDQVEATTDSEQNSN